MKDLVKIAWRNIWRNKRRTFITAASILFAVLLSVLMNAIQKGAWDKMVDNVVNFYYGYGQIHSKGYWDEQSIDKAFELEPAMAQLDTDKSDVPPVVPRLESFALAYYAKDTVRMVDGNLQPDTLRNSRGVLVVGTSPSAEQEMTHLANRLVGGRYLEEGANEILVAEGIMEKMKMSIGDSLVLISQGYHGVNAVGKYPVVGVVKFGSPELNKQIVYLPLKTAQRFYGTPNLVTGLALNISKKDAAPHVLQTVRKELPEDTYEVMSWQEMMPDLVEAQQMDTAGNYIVLVILYIIIAFGIFGTILMMTKEREYEFGILTAIGMNRRSLSFSIWLEIVMLGLIGAAAGILVSLPIVYYFHVNPLDFGEMSEQMAETYEKFGFEPVFPAAFDFNIFMNHTLVVLLITTVLAIYPTLKIMRLKPVEAMRH
ncbi:MAG: ABC transporter permease [Phaeodactylibacter sp.]|nr:ABC transporter permease [Phaeodactylibacter sp.]